MGSMGVKNRDTTVTSTVASEITMTDVDDR